MADLVTLLRRMVGLRPSPLPGHEHDAAHVVIDTRLDTQDRRLRALSERVNAQNAAQRKRT